MGDGNRGEVRRLQERLAAVDRELARLHAERAALRRALAGTDLASTADAAGRVGTDRWADPWDAVSPAELAVTGLVAQGLGNREIARRLRLSHYTVETHLKHVFSKLGVASRAELAASATRRALGEDGEPGRRAGHW